jgi:hypothetical protein
VFLFLSLSYPQHSRNHARLQLIDFLFILYIPILIVAVLFSFSQIFTVCSFTYFELMQIVEHRESSKTPLSNEEALDIWRLSCTESLEETARILNIRLEFRIEVQKGTKGCAELSEG